MIDYANLVLSYSDEFLANEIKELYQKNVLDNNVETFNKLIICLQHAKFRGVKSNYIDFLSETSLMLDNLPECGISFGADPEFMLLDKENQFVLFDARMVTDWFSLSSARIGGDLGLLEFRVPPSCDIDVFIENINDLREQFKKSWDKNGITISDASAITIPLTKLIINAKEKDPTLCYGSSKDNSYLSNTGAVMIEGRTFYAYRDKPNNNDYTFTSCGGHLHFGGLTRSFTQKQVEYLVKLFDTYLAPIYLSIETPTESCLRRKYYGLAGEYRMKQHGFEYRTPSNSLFLKKNEGVLREVLEKSLWVIQNMVELTPDPDAQATINNCKQFFS